MIRNRLAAIAWRSSLAVALLAAPALSADWKPADGPLMTRWAKDVRADKVLPEYPRPQLVRDLWMNLNGVWELQIGKEGEAAPFGKALPESILVPFPVESALSGVMKRADRLWYRRTFATPDTWAGRKVLLHFGAVDWESTVWVNGQEMGTHRGGYDGFSFDITPALKPGPDNEIIVRVFDPTSSGPQPRGKQVNNPKGIYYTPITGIWQTVWLEPVAATAHIAGLHIVPDLDGGKLRVTADVAGDAATTQLAISVLDGTANVGTASGPAGGPIEVAIPNAKPWTPETPHLYGLLVTLRQNGAVVDSVGSYAGLRKIEVSPDEKGVNRIKLNGKVIFQVGPLDQGYWPDGLYTAPTDEALKYDLEVTKQLGFNMTRKHVKVEPDRWYYWADKLGLLVWQDMPSGEKSISPSEPDIVRSPESAKIYETELKAMIDGRRNHPSIVMWVPFNEGWGQYDTKRIADWVKSYDPTRLVDAVSGWADRAGVGDVHDLHNYPRPAAPPLEPKRAGVLGEFGGLSLGVDGHTWTKEIWGYQGTKSADELTSKYERLLREGWDMRETKGLNALVYTQITDVETEANGLLTYDREVIKVDVERARAINRGDASKVPTTRDLAPTGQAERQPWKYTTEKPADNWTAVDADESSWKDGLAVFGTRGTPGAHIGTVWNTPDIWARRVITLPDPVPAKIVLLTLYDEDAEYYLNGVLAATVKGHVSSYDELPISAEARAALKPGKNVLAVHCHQTTGGQAIDVGVAEIVAPVVAPAGAR
ncbi:sugar-binding domain-containing protein [Tundrisphaera sp. TA3]|uniref:glycoside hydrolase family 2 protein n=1 Tax=Tundrisphaera sp. TA3 TaxID=3435775 RepID=UPI003EB78B72